MAQLRIDGEDLVVRLGVVDAMFSVKTSFRVPLSLVTRAYSDPFVHEEPRGFKAPGTHVPGVVSMGTFRAEGVKTFWNIRRGTNVVVVELEGHEFDRVIVEQDDADAVAELIDAEAARHRPGRGTNGGTGAAG
jgi:hypothetical protein